MNHISSQAKKNVSIRITLVFLITAALAYTVFLAVTTVYSADDYWYSTFFRDGISGYIRLMKEHYLSFNGRWLVHFFVHVILYLGNAVFALFLSGCCILIPGLYYLMEKKSGKAVNGLLLCALLFIAGFLALPRDIMVNGVLWISAFCNYMLPTAMVFGEIMLLGKLSYIGSSHAADILTCLYCLMCGATTEQLGTLSAAVSLYFVIKCFLRNRKRLRVTIYAFLFSVCGIVSVFLSPATRNRVNSETINDIAAGQGLFLHIKTQLGLQAEFFSSSFFIILVIAVLFIHSGCIIASGGGTIRKLLSVVWLFVSAAATAALLISGGANPVPYAAILLLTLIQSALYLISGREVAGLVMFIASASLGIMLFAGSGSGGSRTFIPFCLCILAIAAYVISDAAEKMQTGGYILTSVLPAVLSFIIISVQLPGYFHNFIIDRKNRTNALNPDKNNAVYYCIDYDRSYTHSKAYEDGYFYIKWRESAGLADSCKVYFYSENLPCVYVNGVLSQFPAFAGDSGEWLLPFESTLISLGGEIISSERSRIVFRYGVADYTLSINGDLVTVEWSDDNNIVHISEGRRTNNFLTLCISENIFKEALGLNIEYKSGSVIISG